MARSDKPSGETKVVRVRSAGEAIDFINRNLGQRGWHGFSFAYLTGFRSPKFLVGQLEGTRTITFEEGPSVTFEPKLKTPEALDAADVEHGLEYPPDRSPV
jgi:hypothetical protein